MKYLRNDPALKERRRALRQNQTAAERRLWQQLRNQRLQGLKFFRQYSVGVYILDFYCPAVKLAVELDGGQHNFPENQDSDALRSRFLVAQGIQGVRFWNHEVMLELPSVLERLMEITSHRES